MLSSIFTCLRQASLFINNYRLRRSLAGCRGASRLRNVLKFTRPVPTAVNNFFFCCTVKRNAHLSTSNEPFASSPFSLSLNIIKLPTCMYRVFFQSFIRQLSFSTPATATTIIVVGLIKDSIPNRRVTDIDNRITTVISRICLNEK